MRNSASCLFRTSCCVALLALGPAPVTAANLGGTITYRAPGTTKASPLASVLVTVYNPADRRKTVTRTNETGGYLFKNLPSGVFVILVERGGSRIYQGKVDVREPETRRDIGL